LFINVAKDDLILNKFLTTTFNSELDFSTHKLVNIL
jgi:hypothetical protein